MPVTAACANARASSMADLARTASEADLADVEPLPYRRVLSDDEEAREWRAVSNRWGIGPGYWYPLSDPTVPGLELMAFDAPEFRRDVGIALRELLVAQGLRRVLEFREGGPARELALELLDPLYDGLEGFWTARGADWIIYASHETSMTVGGAWLIEALKARWPAWQRHVWEFGSWEDTTARGAT